MTVIDIVKKYLRDHGYDGLAGDGCGCSVNGLAPCDNIGETCEPAHRRTCGPDCPLWEDCENKQRGQNCYVAARHYEEEEK